MERQQARDAGAATPLRAAPLLLVCVALGCAHAAPQLPPAVLAARVLPPPAEALEAAQPRATITLVGHEGTVSGPPHAADPRVVAGPLTLEHAIALAFDLQPRLRIYRERVAEARGRGEVAFAPFLPQLTLNGRAFAGNNPTGPADGAPLPLPYYPTTRGYQNFAASELSLLCTLWDFGRTYGRYRHAELAEDIAALQSDRAAQTIAFEVAAAYARVLQTLAAGRVARESVRLAESVLDVARKSLKAGLVEKDQVLRAEVQLAQARRSVVTAEKAERIAVAALNLAVGLNVSAPTEVVEIAEEPPFALSLGQCLQLAVENRREFQVVQRAVESAAELGRVARAEFLPRVTAEATFAAADGHRTLNGTTESGAIYFSWGLFQGGRRQGEVRAADAATRAAAAQAESVCDTIAYEVNEAYREIVAARDTIALARPAVAQARENLRLLMEKYKTGDATPTDVVDAETALTRAETDLYTARYDYLTALARIDYATGTTPPKRGHSSFSLSVSRWQASEKDECPLFGTFMAAGVGGEP